MLKYDADCKTMREDQEFFTVALACPYTLELFLSSSLVHKFRLSLFFHLS